MLFIYIHLYLFINLFIQVKADDVADTFVAVWGSTTGIEDAEVRLKLLRKVELDNLKSAILYYEMLNNFIERELVSSSRRDS